MVRLGVVMDPLQSINIKKDSTLTMLEEAQRRDGTVYFMSPKDLTVKDGKPLGNLSLLTIDLKKKPWYQIQPSPLTELNELDVILMRKDPPFDMDYIYITYIKFSNCIRMKIQ